MLILVIDDDELSRELLTLLLEVEGYTVASAASGGEGLSRLGEMNPHPEAVLTDLQMPGISGTELATALRSALPHGVPVIAMSGSDSRPPGTPALAPAGFDGFLLKPFSVANLQETLAAAAMQTEASEKPERGPAIQIFPLELLDDPGVACLNEEVFSKMQELMPAPQLGQMYALCIADARTRLTAMEALAGAEDNEGYRREAHAIKGGAGMIGAAEIYKLSTQAEYDGLSAGTSRVTASLDQLSRACERLERILMERLKP